MEWIGRVLLKNIFSVATVALIGCTHTPNQATTPGVKYKLTPEIEVIAEKKKVFRGIGTAPKASTYEICVEAPNDIHHYSAVTCSREIVKRDVGDDECIDFSPDQIFEGVGDYCPIYLTGLSADRDQHVFGQVVFEHEKFQLEADVICNGERSRSVGVGVCQLREGMPLAIKFAAPVISETECYTHPGVLERIRGVQVGEGQLLKFKVPPGECVHYFGNKSGKFRLTTYGYQAIIHESLD